MVNLYATLIINKRRTLLLEYGYDTNGDPIAEEE